MPYIALEGGLYRLHCGLQRIHSGKYEIAGIAATRLFLDQEGRSNKLVQPPIPLDATHYSINQQKHNYITSYFGSERAKSLLLSSCSFVQISGTPLTP